MRFINDFIEGFKFWKYELWKEFESHEFIKIQNLDSVI